MNPSISLNFHILLTAFSRNWPRLCWVLTEVWFVVLSLHGVSAPCPQWHFDPYDPHGLQFAGPLRSLSLATHAGRRRGRWGWVAATSAPKWVERGGHLGGSETLSFSGGYELAAGKPNPQIEPRSRNNNIITGYIYIYVMGISFFQIPSYGCVSALSCSFLACLRWLF